MNLTIQTIEWLFFALSGNKLLTQFVVNLSIYSHSLRTVFDCALFLWRYAIWTNSASCYHSWRLLKRNAGDARFSPTDRRSLGPPGVCCAHFPAVSNGLSGWRLRFSAPTSRTDLPGLHLSSIQFFFEKNGDSTAFYHTFHSTDKGKCTTPGSSWSWSICKPLSLIPGMIHLLHQRKIHQINERQKPFWRRHSHARQ